MFDNIFPTTFALTLAIKTGMLNKRITSEFALHDYAQDNDITEEDGQKASLVFLRIKEFQEIATLSDYENAVKVFHDLDLTGEQENALKLIAELTPTWVKGRVSHRLVQVINDQRTDEKALANIAQALLNAMNDGNIDLDEKGSGNAKKVVKTFVQRLTVEKD